MRDAGIQLQVNGAEVPNAEFVQELIANVNRLKDENQRLAQSWIKLVFTLITE